MRKREREGDRQTEGWGRTEAWGRTGGGGQTNRDKEGVGWVGDRSREGETRERDAFDHCGTSSNILFLVSVITLITFGLVSVVVVRQKWQQAGEKRMLTST